MHEGVILERGLEICQKKRTGYKNFDGRTFYIHNIFNDIA